ncbi:hypothetical protein O3M35_003947 [Rhynocoris fuscipes]|uniref:Uncharacterized protein n=1 Tax=Rhynocoris fuscipes TaxID=488301 RepID=A0AAW1CJ06_9HEMI
MDDLKIYSSNRDQLLSMTEEVSSVSEAIKMDFGLDKCTVLEVKRGKVHATEGLQLHGGVALQGLDVEEKYKYLGMYQILEVNHGQVQDEIVAAFKVRLSKVLGTSLSAKDKIDAINSWAMPLVEYSFGVIKWSKTALEALDRLVRRMMKECRMLHPRCSIARLYLPRCEGGRGLVSLLERCRIHKEGLREYFCQQKRDICKAVVAVDDGFSALEFGENEGLILEITVEDRKAEWASMALHGAYYGHLHAEGVDVEASVAWLEEGSLFPETEGFIAAIQDQVVPTRYYLKRIVQDNTVQEEACRLCGSAPETIFHIISSRPDVVWHDKKEGKVYIIDVSVPDSNNLAAAYSEKVRKYRDLSVEILAQWTPVASVITVPIVMSALAVVPRTLIESLARLGLKRDLYKPMQKAVILATCRTVRLVLGV